MGHPGIGAMLHWLSGNSKTVEAFTGAIGKTITEARIDGDHNGGDGGLVLKFTDGTGIVLFDDGRSCCENRYMHTDDDLAFYAGATLLDAEIKDGPTETDEYDEPKESQFLAVRTSKVVSKPGLRKYENEIEEFYYGRKDNVDIIDTIFLHFKVQIIPKKMPEVPAWEPKIEDSFHAQAKRDLAYKNMPFDEYVGRLF